ncbi:tRNA pseudouridine(13) synthase TruD [Desulfothermus naphthae]
MKIDFGDIKISIKERVQDFQVQEIVDFPIKNTGDFGVYILKKWGANTWDVLGDVKKRLRRSAREIAYAGLKDRHAITSQYITIYQGPKKDIKGKNYNLKYLGQTDRPISRSNLKGNRFKIKIRVSKDIPEDFFLRQVELVEKYGIPNYYDDQRFSSVPKNKLFFAKELILKRYKNALYSILVNSSQKESSKTKKFRECLKENWGDFSKCLSLAPPNWEKQVLKILSSGKLSNSKIKKALSIIDREFLFFQCNVYQSYVWNKVLKNFLKSLDIPLKKVPGEIMDLFFYRSLRPQAFDQVITTQIPLPGPNIVLESNLFEIYRRVLEEEGIKDIGTFRTRVKGAVFKSNPRHAIFIPDIFKWEKSTPYIWQIDFFLQKGSYATIFIKRLFLFYEE